MSRTKPIAIGVSEAKRPLSEMLEQVACGRKAFPVINRGRPMARLVPPTDSQARSLRDLRSWLDENYPFFEITDRIVKERLLRPPRGAESSDLGVQGLRSLPS